MTQSEAWWDNEISDFEYFAHPFISATDISLSLKGPSHFFFETKTAAAAKRTSAAKEFGTAFHELILNPRFAETYGKGPTGAEFLPQKLTKTAVENLNRMKQRVLQVFPLFTENEKTGVFKEDAGFVEGEGLRCKVDLRCPEKKLIVDLKTTTEATPSKFQWSAREYNYHLQAAHYLDCANKIDGPGTYTSFLFVVVEKTWPYKVFVFECSDRLLEEALEVRNAQLELIRKWKSEERVLMEEVLKEQDQIYALDYKIEKQLAAISS